MHDTRSALENLVWAVGDRLRLTERELRKNQFPCIAESEKWDSHKSSRLRHLPEAVISRIEAIQPFRQTVPEGLRHPLEFLHEAWNVDKHRAGFRIILAPSPPPGQHLLTTLEFQLPAEDVGGLEETIRRDIDKWFDFGAGPVLDGSIVATLRLPPGYRYEKVVPGGVDLPLGLSASLTSESGVDQIIPAMDNAIGFAREAVRFVTAVEDSPPPHPVIRSAWR